MMDNRTIRTPQDISGEIGSVNLLGNNHRPRVQILDRRYGIPYAYNDDKLIPRDQTSYKNITLNYGPNCGPSWVEYDKKVLSFDGYWMESVVDNPDQKYIVRSCKVLYYLVDDTIQVLEPRMANSSLVQGTIVKRRRILLPPPNDTEFYNVHHLNIGELIYLCGRCIKLVSCDKFTHNYLRQLGVKIPFPMTQPLDPFQEAKNKNTMKQKKGKGYYKHADNLGQFLDNNKHILRFYCFWDNTDLPNDPRSMILYYFLEDDTIEINEILPRNCGREGKLFLRRQLLPKNFASSSLNFPGHLSDPSYLNVIKTAKYEHKTLDSLSMGDTNFPCYKDHDLSLGQYINVLGRKFMLCDCDEFTKEYYRIKYGITNFNSKDMSQYWDKGEVVTKFIAPHNGWGSEEDSMLNCLNIRPSEVVKSAKEFMTIKRTIDDLLVLHFWALIHKPLTKFDKQRRFLISYRIEDNRFSVKEQTSENFEHDFEAFMSRDSHMKPKKLWKDTYVPEYYRANDFYIGALVEMKGLVFEIILTDDYSLKYMENHAFRFIHSSLERILNKMRKYLSNSKTDLEYFFKKEDPLDTGLVNFMALKAFKKAFADDLLNEQELVTLARLYKEKVDENQFNANKAKAKIRQKLRQHSFMDYYLIKEHWYAMSPDRTLLHEDSARAILKGLKVPLSNEMICDLLKLSRTGLNKDVDLCKLLEVIEWQKLQPDYYEQVGKYLECDQFKISAEAMKTAELNPENTFKIGMILWKDILNDIFNPPNSSKVHPTTQRMMQTAHCQHTYD